MSLNSSEFAALRAVAHLLSSEGKIDSEQSEWFLEITRSYGVTHDQHEILRGDLSGSSKLAEIHAQITNAKDRERLLNWARVVMSINHKPHPKEREVFAKIKALNEQIDSHLRDSYHDAAVSMIQLDKSQRMWRDLEEAGRLFSEPYYGSGYGLAQGNSYGAGAAIALFAKAFSSRNRFAQLAILILVALIALWEYAITKCSH